MSQPMLLAFNMMADRKTKLNLACMKNKIRIVTVEPSEQGYSLGALCGFMPKANPQAGGFMDEMIVMVNFTERTLNSFLQTWKSLGQKPIRLKAVATSTNITWSSVKLHNEIAMEDAAMRNNAASVHENKSAE